MSTNVKIELKELDPGELGFDVEIDQNSDPTVQDYLNAMNNFQNTSVSGCDGCTNCCWERVPVTYQDMVKYMALLGTPKSCEGSYKDGEIHPNFESVNNATEFAEKYCEIENDGNVIDIRLKRKLDNSCIFLDTMNNRCGAWAARGFICQSYICLASSRKARDLRQKIVNVGEDMLLEAIDKEKQGETVDFPRSYADFRIKEILNK